MHDILPIPNSFKEIMRHAKWVEAMEKEYKALPANDTWVLVPPPPGKKIIRNRWVYVVKLKPDRTLERYKSIVVTKWYDQVKEIDYFETFNSFKRVAS